MATLVARGYLAWTLLGIIVFLRYYIQSSVRGGEEISLLAAAWWKILARAAAALLSCVPLCSRGGVERMRGGCNVTFGDATNLVWLWGYFVVLLGPFALLGNFSFCWRPP